MSQVYGGYAPYVMPGQLPRPADVPANAQTFLAYVHEDKIYKSDAQGSQIIGVPSKVYDALQEDYDSLYSTCKEYYDKLVKAEIIRPEPTQEDIIRKQAEQLAQASEIIAQSAKTQQTLYEMVKDLTDKIEKLSSTKSEECENEYAGKNGADGADGSGVVAQVENDDRASGRNSAELPEHPRGFASCDSGEKSKNSRPSKGTVPPAKRPRR